MRFLIATLLLASSLGASSAGAQAQDDLDKVIALSKITGNCGMVVALFRFQETTQMAGGDEFLARFLTTEAARLGETPLAFAERCTRVTDWYVKFTAAAKEVKDEPKPVSRPSIKAHGMLAGPAVRGKYILLDDEPAPHGKPARAHP